MGLLTVALGACGPAPLEPRDPTPGTFHFKVATYNVEYLEARDLSTLQAVGATDADIIALQETTPLWQLAIEDAYGDAYPYMLFHTREENSAGGLAMLSRFPLEELGLIDAPFGWHPALHVLAHTPAGPLQVLNVHLRGILNGRSSKIDSYLTAGEDHLKEIEVFSRRDGTYATLAVGDFNETEDGPALRYLEKLGFENALPLFHPGQGTWRYRSVAGQFDKALDHILFDSSFAPLNAYVLRKGNSDHIPVVAHLEATTDWFTLAANP